MKDSIDSPLFPSFLLQTRPVYESDYGKGGFYRSKSGKGGGKSGMMSKIGSRMVYRQQNGYQMRRTSTLLQNESDPAI
jgi:hypothetical protein